MIAFVAMLSKGADLASFRTDFSSTIEQQWGLHFAEYFAEDLQLLSPLAKRWASVDISEGNSGDGEGRLLITAYLHVL